MFDNKIVFTAHEDYVAIKEDLPKPIKLNIPEWYKKIQHTLESKTIKGCMPFLETLTTGYILSCPQDIKIKHNFFNEETKQPDTGFKSALGNVNDFLRSKLINLNTDSYQYHPTAQLEGSPLIEKNKNLAFFKILNPWLIETPPGYSCLFLSPLNNRDDRFEIISGIVNTDTYKQEINFPIVFNGDKYPTLDTTIEKGTPYVQVIPFKRESWEMQIKSTKTKDIFSKTLQHSLILINRYRDYLWNKTRWK
jgi:hypothetical protein